MWQSGEFTVWVQYVKDACKTAVQHLIKSSKKNDEVHMMKKLHYIPALSQMSRAFVHLVKTKNVFRIFTSKNTPTYSI